MVNQIWIGGAETNSSASDCRCFEMDFEMDFEIEAEFEIVEPQPVPAEIGEVRTVAKRSNAKTTRMTSMRDLRAVTPPLGITPPPLSLFRL